MNEEKTLKGIPPEGIDTPKGHLYYPPPRGKQVLFLAAAFFTAILLGWLVSSISGIRPGFASGVLCFVFLLIFFLGYGLWVSFASALAFSSIKWPLIKIIFKIFIRNEKPSSISGFLPEKEKLIEMMVRVQKYSRSFLIISVPVGISGGFATMFMSSPLNPSLFFLLVFIASVCYGYLLSYYGRRGYIPLPEE
jgi:hypothetical protein